MRSCGPLLIVLLVVGSLACSEADPPAAPDSSSPPTFISYGEPVATGQFEGVGALLADFDDDGVIEGDELICTGSLIHDSVFLTAGHCVAWLPDGYPVWVSFDRALLDGVSDPIPADGWHFDPLYGQNMGDMHDLAVVLLPEGRTAGRPVYDLPTAGLLDELTYRDGLAGWSFVNVGYGSWVEFQWAPPRSGYDGQLKWSTSPYLSLKPAWLGLHMVHTATGEGGDCYGDSGSPKFLEGYQNPGMIFATVTGGDRQCRATSWDYRLDTPVARSFLGQFVSLP